MHDEKFQATRPRAIIQNMNPTVLSNLTSSRPTMRGSHR
jgi:hypothetical protein